MCTEVVAKACCPNQSRTDIWNSDKIRQNVCEHTACMVYFRAACYSRCSLSPLMYAKYTRKMESSDRNMTKIYKSI